MSYETSPDATASFETVNNDQLINTFLESRGTDEATGTELSLRLIEHAGVPRQAGGMTAYGKDGNPLQNDGMPVSLAGYIPYAAKHHPYAISKILGFLDTRPGEPEYEAGVSLIRDYMSVQRHQA